MAKDVIKVVVNGQELAIEEKSSVSHLLAMRGLAAAACAVEVNRTLVPKRQQQEHVLAEGDQVEIVTLVGGG